MNDFSNISAESNLKDEITVRSDEYDPTANPAYDGPMGVMTDYDGCDSDDGLTEAERAEERDELEMMREDDTAVDAGWPGDGSGTDDLADYNANEADDYRDE